MTFENAHQQGLGEESQFRSGYKNSLESIASESITFKNESFIDRLFSDKTKTLKATVNALLEEVENRRNLNLSLIDKIDSERSYINTDLIHINNQQVNYDFERDKERNKSKFKLEDRVQRLEEEKRKEAVEYWRDIMFLKKDLMSALKEYWDIVKRRELLERRP
jgi:hypothetical protein